MLYKIKQLFSSLTFSIYFRSLISALTRYYLNIPPHTHVTKTTQSFMLLCFRKPLSPFTQSLLVLHTHLEVQCPLSASFMVNTGFSSILTALSTSHTFLKWLIHIPVCFIISDANFTFYYVCTLMYLA